MTEFNHEAEIISLIDKERERAFEEDCERFQDECTKVEELGGEFYQNIQSPSSESQQLAIQEQRTGKWL